MSETYKTILTEFENMDSYLQDQTIEMLSDTLEVMKLYQKLRKENPGVIFMSGFILKIRKLPY